MKIDSSAINLASRHSYYEESGRVERLVFRAGRPAAMEDEPAVIISDAAKEALRQSQAALPPAAAEKEITIELSEEDRARLTLLETLLSALTGKQVRFLVPGKLKLTGGKVKTFPAGSAAVSASARQGWGLEYDLREYYREKESLAVRAAGRITVTGGREIEFAFDFALSREFSREVSLRFRVGDARIVDPLVLNLAGGPARLTAAVYQFDLDGDGATETISFIDAGSGFLALDRNGDGRINDGRELFGPTSGDGFAELASGDADGNGWIDESDPVFSELRIWMKDEQGKDILLALRQAGVGAVYLGSVAAAYSYKAAERLLGQNEKAGLFVRENGTVGSIQQINLAI
ncbi:MAG: FG-GAP repeat domain-containing protein [bacterium]